MMPGLDCDLKEWQTQNQEQISQCHLRQTVISLCSTCSLLFHGLICDVTGQNQALVAICHLPKIQFKIIL